jgi:hypothetical protein
LAVAVDSALLAGAAADSVGVVSDRDDFDGELSVVATLAEAAISAVRLFKRACAESGAAEFNSALAVLRFAGWEASVEVELVFGAPELAAVVADFEASRSGCILLADSAVGLAVDVLGEVADDLRLPPDAGAAVDSFRRRSDGESANFGTVSLERSRRAAASEAAEDSAAEGWGLAVLLASDVALGVVTSSKVSSDGSVASVFCHGINSFRRCTNRTLSVRLGAVATFFSVGTDGNICEHAAKITNNRWIAKLQSVANCKLRRIF